MLAHGPRRPTLCPMICFVLFWLLSMPMSPYTMTLKERWADVGGLVNVNSLEKPVCSTCKYNRHEHTGHRGYKQTRHTDNKGYKGLCCGGGSG